MFEQDRERANLTCKMINNYVDTEKYIRDIVLKNQAAKRDLAQKIKRYVEVVYYKLFEWQNSVNKNLSESGAGKVHIEIFDESPWLFPPDDMYFVEFQAKHFSYLQGKLNIIINTSKTISLEADLMFRCNYGTIKWKDGGESHFICERYRAENMQEFGSKDLSDLLSKLTSWQVQQDRLGNYITARHPGDVINEKLYSALFSWDNQNPTPINYNL
ncbi:hypothetical protein GBZ26_17260 [Azospirillum formosense]|uniref:Uncharacterized protein n=1 Tax=Azospirillum formosense TaxID=861533 RepID=A0ABX2KWD6_9PROT|nr:hypothetical protein [Azospirillum formosense]MBY3752509.1 hypothetical protein [Azospirillum formosense]NUB20936.1 hypothetical protein [Azospirillum formosense]